MALRYLDEQAFAVLSRGHTFDVERCVSLVDKTLVAVNRMNRIPDRIVKQLATQPQSPMPPDFLHGEQRLIIELSNSWKGTSELTMAKVLRSSAEVGVAPVLFLKMHSPVLDIPMRVEIPLRALFKNGANLVDGYSVYLHALFADSGQAFVYYGITRRPWNLRFLEHVKAGQRKGRASKRLFAKKLADLIGVRLDQRFGKDATGPALVGVITTLCLLGGSKEQALELEEYLVDKYSLAGKHPLGLNMIPGGAAGIQVVQKFRLGRGAAYLETVERELASIRSKPAGQKRDQAFGDRG